MIVLIYIKGLEDERFVRPLQLIANLFFEETEICMNEHPDQELVVKIDLTYEKEQIVSSAVLLAGKQEYRASYGKAVTADDEKERFKQVKNIVSHVFLHVLQDYTKITQKWGILTGMRPTKLLHKQHQAGVPAEESRRKLQEEYMITEEKVQLMERILDRQLTMVPDLYKVKDEVSIYIGIPFCPTKCAYCTFPAYAIQGKQGRVSSFLSGLHYEMEQIGRWLREKGVKITTVYYGGGHQQLLRQRKWMSYMN